MTPRTDFPNGARFAFSILDDTDDSTRENVAPVYDTLRECGFRTTKTAWPLDSPEGSRLFFAADTLQNTSYLEFVHELVDDGFELAFHGATMESSPRERTIRGLEFLHREFGQYPRLFCNHGFNRENLYWGRRRILLHLFPRLTSRFIARGRYHYLGDVEGSAYFWGDLCKEHIQYVRNFTFSRLNMLTVNPEMPYRLPETRYVNYWFSTADAPDVHSFNQLLTPERIDRLEQEGGVCILSTHLGKGFATRSGLHPATAQILRYISNKRGWFVPVSEILDHLLQHDHLRRGLSFCGRLRLLLSFLRDRAHRIAMARPSTKQRLPVPASSSHDAVP